MKTNGNQVVVTSDAHPFPMQGWSEEKAAAVVEDLAALVDASAGALTDAQLRGLRPALCNATKLWAFFAGSAMWDLRDADAVLTDGSKGLEALRAKYNDKTPAVRTTAEVLEALGARATGYGFRGKTN